MGKNNLQEEVTITPIIRDFEKLFSKFLQFISSIISGIYSVSKQAFYFIFKNIKQLVIIALVGGILGAISIFVIPREYASHLILDFKIDARNQLESDVYYFSNLIEKEQFKRISEILEITVEEAETLTSFEVNPYYSNIRNIRQLNTFYKDLDTALHQYVDFEELFNNDQNPEISDQFVILVHSKSQSIFSKIEKPLIKFLERVPELQAERLNTLKRLSYEKRVLETEILKLDTLKSVLNKVMIEQSKSNSKSNTGTTINMGQSQDQFKLNPLDIYNQIISYSKDIVIIDEKLQYYDSCYEIRTHFSAFGRKSGFGGLNRALIGALIFFVLGSIFIVIKIISDKVGE